MTESTDGRVPGHPEAYRHWRLSIDGPVATLAMDVDEHGGLVPGYELKLNSYDLGVDIELYDAVQRLRFEHPEVRAVVLTSAKDKIFCAGANIRMLAASPHPWKVNFCKFTNETRNGIEDATAHSGQTYLAALNGTASGGGYELALACEHIMLVDDRSSAVSLPELPLLGVLPGTGGLTRVVDKRHVRRDLADYFSTRSEGVGGKKAVRVAAGRRGGAAAAVGRDGRRPRAAELAARSDPPADATGIALTPLDKTAHRRRDRLPARDGGARPGRGHGRHHRPRAASDAAGRRRRDPRAGRRLLDARDDPRARRPDPRPAHQRDRARHLGAAHGRATRTGSSPTTSCCWTTRDDWLANEIVLYLKRTLKRLDVTSRSLIALIEPGSCFAGSLLELALAADRSFQLAGVFEDDVDPDAAPARSRSAR